MIGLTLFIESSRGRGFYARSIRNVTIIFVAAVGSCIRGGKKAASSSPRRIRPVADRRPPSSSSGAAGTPNLARGDRKDWCKLVSIRGYIGSR